MVRFEGFQKEEVAEVEVQQGHVDVDGGRSWTHPGRQIVRCILYASAATFRTGHPRFTFRL